MITADRRKSDAATAAVISHSIKPSLLIFKACVTSTLVFLCSVVVVVGKKARKRSQKHAKICVANPKLAQM